MPSSRTASGRRRHRACGTEGGREENCAWLEAVLAATDLVCWAKLIWFAHVPSPALCEIAAFRYRVLHVAAPFTRYVRRASRHQPSANPRSNTAPERHPISRVKEGG
jgi:hypothetical protein